MTEDKYTPPISGAFEDKPLYKFYSSTVTIVRETEARVLIKFREGAKIWVYRNQLTRMDGGEL